MESETLFAALTALEPQLSHREKCNSLAVEVPSERLLEFMSRLRDDPQLKFDMLCAHTAVDWLNAGRFELIYFVQSLTHQHSLMVFTSIPREKPVVASVSSIWRIAEWQEREVYDLFGVLYQGHPDLRRLFLEEGWEGFPLRKDYEDDFMLEFPEWK